MGYSALHVKFIDFFEYIFFPEINFKIFFSWLTIFGKQLNITYMNMVKTMNSWIFGKPETWTHFMNSFLERFKRKNAF